MTFNSINTLTAGLGEGAERKKTKKKTAQGLLTHTQALFFFKFTHRANGFAFCRAAMPTYLES